MSQPHISPFASPVFPHSRLNSLGIHFPFLVAPMVGLSHVAFRELIRSYVPSTLSSLIFTEMLSTRRLPSERLQSSNEIKTAENESFFVPQLLGNEEKFIAPSIEKLLQLKPFGFDINMGCPASHVLKHNWGVRLLGDKNYAAEVVRIAKKHSPLPVSVKLRGGAEESEDPEYLKAFTGALEDAGADWITIHPRPRAQGHKGEANWALVSEVRAARNIPVVANGNIQTADDALLLLNEFKVDGAMIARAATARPWILWQIAEKLGIESVPPGYEGQKAPQTPEEEGREYGRACVRMLTLMRFYYSEDEYILEKFSFFAATGCRWFQFGHSFWKLTRQAKNYPELLDKVSEFFEKYESHMTEKIKFN